MDYAKMVFPKPRKMKKKKEQVIQIQMQDKKECWVCNRTDTLQEHHVYYGPLRSISEKYGLKVWLCMRHHTGSVSGDKGIHHSRTRDLLLKTEAQRKFERVYSREEFMKLFGRSYL